MTKNFLLFLCLAPLLVRAQESPTPEQMLAIAQAAIRLPEHGAWTIKFSDAAPQVPRPPAPADSTAAPASASPERKAVSLAATRAGKLQQDVITWSDGKTSESWWLDRVWLAEEPATVDGFLFNVNRWPGRVNIAAWIGPDSLQGIQSLGGRKCIVFEKEVSLFVLWPGYAAKDGNSGSLKAAAYVSLDDGKLLRVRLGDVNADFSWQSAPDGELSIPPRFAKRYKAIVKALGPKLEKLQD